VLLPDLPKLRQRALVERCMGVCGHTYSIRQHTLACFSMLTLLLHGDESKVLLCTR
jgi:hypothetical protein